MKPMLDIEEICSLERRMLRAAFHHNLKRGAIFSLAWLLCVIVLDTAALGYPLPHALITSGISGSAAFFTVVWLSARQYRRQLRELALAHGGVPAPP